MKSWLKLGFLAAAMAFLAACSSGLQDSSPATDTPNSDTELSTLATTVSHSVPDGPSDAEQSGSYVYKGSNVLEMGVFNGTAQTVGVRFLGVNVPKGAKITSAYIEFIAGTSSSEATSLQIAGQDLDSAGPFSDGSGDLISNRVKTTARATWNPTAWTYGNAYRTSSLSSIVQEVVNRSGWQQGAAMAFTITGTGFRRAAAFEHDTLAPAKLVVSYDLPTANAWAQRLKQSLTSGRYKEQTSDSNHRHFNPDRIASDGDQYYIGRNANQVVTSWLLAYRETGDNTFIYYVDRFMDQLKAAVGDRFPSPADGFREILFRQAGDYYLEDTAHMDEMLSHGFIASMTLALKEAGATTGNSSYTSTANWWFDYLKNDFEAKWNYRTQNKLFSAPLRHGLTHPRTNYIRFYYAMYKLTGQSSYLTKAQSEASLLKQTIRTDGWAHYFGETSGCSPSVYIPITVIGMVDLATNGSNLLDTATMQRAANVVATKVFKDNEGDYMGGSSCGNSTYGGQFQIKAFTYTPIGAWDGSGRIQAISEHVYNAQENGTDKENPLGTQLPAGLAFVTLH